MPTLVLVIRFIALSLIINALSAIHRTKLIISVNFKTQSKISLGAAFISGVIGCITGMSFYILLSFLFKLDSFFVF